MTQDDASKEKTDLQHERDNRKSFCIYPFRSMNVTPSGEVKPCCAFGRPIEREGRSMSVYEHTIDEIWNSTDMRDIRRSMVEGRPVGGCSYCYEQENKGLRSMWTSQTENWTSGVFNPLLETIEQLTDRARVDDYKIADGAEWFDLDIGNLCNFQCRMCNATYSSRIANDPIHSRWTGLPQAPIRWQGKSAIIAPRQMLGVIYEGFQYREASEGSKRSWTNGIASVRLDTRNLDIVGVAVQLKLEQPSSEPVTITANGTQLFQGPITSSWRQEFAAPFLKDAAELEIRIESAIAAHSATEPPAGLGVEEISLIRSSTGRSTVALSRFARGAQWFQEREFLIGELLANPDKVKKIHMIGGEPLLIKEVRQIMRHLIETGAAGNVVLVLTTNGSCGDDEWFDLASKFAASYVAVSVEGCGSVNEYIRFPSSWQLVKANIAKFNSQPDTMVDVNMTVQAYNILDIVELAEFCRRVGVGFRGHFLQYPNYLSPYVLPPKIREVAAERLRAYIETCDAPPVRTLPPAFKAESVLRPSSTEALEALASSLENGPQDVDADLLRRFMLFTNDLDATRGQSFGTALPELREMIEMAGFPWIPDLTYAV